MTCQNPDGCGNSTDRTALIAGKNSTFLVVRCLQVLRHKFFLSSEIDVQHPFVCVDEKYFTVKYFTHFLLL